MTPVEVLRALEAWRLKGAGDKWRSQCPAHEGKDRNLVITFIEGKALFACHSHQCSYEDIISALRLKKKERSLFEKTSNENARVVEYHTYDIAGKLVATHKRTVLANGKKAEVLGWFRDGKPGLAGLPTKDLPLYGSQRINGFNPALPIDICEGQPATEALLGCMAQCIGTYGTGNEPTKETLSWVKGFTVRLWPDNDPVNEKTGLINGVEHMRAVAKVALSAGAAKVILLDTRSLPIKGDAVEWLEAQRALGDTQELVEKLKGEEVPGLPVLEVYPVASKTFPKGRTLEEFLALKAPPRVELCGPWLREQTITEIYGWRGAGKSWFGLHLAYCVSVGVGFLSWAGPKEPKRVVYFDGEMGIDDLQSRLPAIRQSEEKRAGRKLNSKLILFSDSDLEQFPDGLPRLGTPEGKELVEAQLVGGPCLVVFDNLSTLWNSAIENDAESWVETQDWFISLRRRGHSVVFLHHSGKSGAQRGTSKREDACNNVIALKQPENHQASDGCAFTVKFEKSRGVYGPPVLPFEAKLTTDEQGDLIWALASKEPTKNEQIEELLRSGVSVANVAKLPGFVRSQVYKVAASLTKQPTGACPPSDPSGGLSYVLPPKGGVVGHSDKHEHRAKKNIGQVVGQTVGQSESKPHQQRKLPKEVVGQPIGQPVGQDQDNAPNTMSYDVFRNSKAVGQPKEAVGQAVGQPKEAVGQAVGQPKPDPERDCSKALYPPSNPSAPTPTNGVPPFDGRKRA